MPWLRLSTLEQLHRHDLAGGEVRPAGIAGDRLAVGDPHGEPMAVPARPPRAGITPAGLALTPAR
jgi:hypothetical protein